MPTLTRYVLLELTKTFAFALGGITLMIIMLLVFKEAAKQGLGLAQVAKLVPYLLPSAMQFAVPGTVLFTVCSVFGRMSGSNEVVAVKSMGISPMVLVWPGLVFAFLMSLTTVWLNDLANSWGIKNARRVCLESITEIAYDMLSSKHSYSNSQFSINVWKVEGRKLKLPTLLLHESANGPAMTVTAQEAELRSNPQQNSLTILLRNGKIDIGRGASCEFSEPQEFDIPLTENGKNEVATPSNLPLRVIPEESRRQNQLVLRSEQQMAARAAFQLLLGQPTQLASASWSDDQNVLSDQRYRLQRLHTEPHRRWANGFSCLCFVLIGAPLAIHLRNTDFLQTFMMVFGPVLIVYYPLLTFGVDLAKSGTLPPYAVWLGNVILVLIGLGILRKVLR